MNKPIIILAGLALFFVLSSIGTAYGAIYVMIPDIKGDVTAEGHVGWIEIDSLSESFDRELKSSSAKGGTSDINIGIAQISEIVVKKGLDSSSASLAQASINGNSLGEIKFCLVEQSISGCYQTYELARSFVKSWSTSGDADDRPTEEVAFYFNSIRIIQYSYDGKEYQETSRTEWDLVKNTPTYSGKGEIPPDTTKPLEEKPLDDKSEEITDEKEDDEMEEIDEIMDNLNDDLRRTPNTFISPRMQMDKGIAVTDVVCNEGKELMIKTSTGAATCVKSSSIPQLIARGWGTLS